MMKTSYDVENRQIRVFISSTFQDMQSERDYLITKVFRGYKPKRLDEMLLSFLSIYVGE